MKKTLLDEMKSLSVKRNLGWPFWVAGQFGIVFDEHDVKYINNVIKNDKIYRMLVMADQRWEYTVIQDNSDNKDDGLKVVSSPDGNFMTFIENCNAIHFLGKFLNDSKCPKNVKYFLWCYIGDILGSFKENGTYKDYVQQSFFTERWMEICR